MGLLVVAGFSPANYHLFDRLGISAPRGVLLHGHPGTGKTLVVRALAGACSRGGQQVSYFARKGADILGKYVVSSFKLQNNANQQSFFLMKLMDLLLVGVATGIRHRVLLFLRC
jgi:replication-associated recombination protein RarA